MNLPIKKIEIIIDRSKKENIFEEIQKLGKVEIVSKENLSLGEDSFRVPQYADLNFARNFLIQYKTKESVLKNIIKEKKSFKISDLQSLSKSEEIKEIVSFCEKTEEKITFLNSKKEILEKEIDILKKVEGLSIDSHTELKKYNYIIGFLKEESKEAFLKEIESFSFSIEFNKNNYFLLIYKKEEGSYIKEIIHKYNIKEEKVFWDKEITQNLNEKEKEFKNILIEIEILKKESEKIANSLPEIEALIDYYSWEIEKLKSLNFGEETKKYYRIEAYIVEKFLPKLKEIIKEVSSNSIVSELEPEEGEKVPVYLENSGLISSFMSVTNIYGLPKRDEFDPTPHLAFFFILFFGLALSDSGYGIMLVVLSLIAKKILKGESYNRFFNLFIMAGISTIIAGFLTGTFFGTEFFAGYRLIDPVKDPINTLLFMMFLGMIQIFVGIIIGMFQSLKQGNKIQAFGEKGGGILFFVGLFLFLLTNFSIFVILGIALLFILNILFSSSKGIFSRMLSGFGALYGIIGYFSDILSYSRLLALGLATGIIAMVINIIAILSKEMIPIPVLNWVVMIAVLVFGHLANLLINALGSFIHSSRLQFVEFFSKFMEGGGRNFKPLSKKGQFIEVIN